MCDTDFNDDLTVGGPDFTIMAGAYDSEVGDELYDPDVDVNSDGDIEGYDYARLIFYLGSPPGPSGLGCQGTIPCQ